MGKNWSDIHNEVVTRSRVSAHDIVRRTYLEGLSKLTGRNTVAYYSGWLQTNGPDVSYLVSINDDDKNGFMACFHGLEPNLGLDLILHSPGGNVAATESIIHYIRSKFGRNVRTIVPQISMSGGTMIALSGYEIWMGRHSNLGPIDPQFGSWPAVAILEEFERAKAEVAADPNLASVWHPILSKYHPTLLSTADRAIKWSKDIGIKTLEEGMFYGKPDATAAASGIVEFLLSHNTHHAHNRHLHREELMSKGLVVRELESNQDLQDAVLSVHHAFMHTMMNTQVLKIIENQNHIALVRQMNIQAAGQMIQLQIPKQPVAQPQNAEKPSGQKSNGNPAPFWSRIKRALSILFNR